MSDGRPTAGPGRGGSGPGPAPQLAARVTALRELLRRNGVEAEADAAGTAGEIAAVRGAPALRPRLAALADEVRALGFRYVALEPDGGTHSNEDP